MSRLHGPSFLRTSIGRLAVTGAATLVTVTGFAPAAVAADGDLAPESGSPDTSSEPLASSAETHTDDASESTSVGTPPPPAEEQVDPPVDGVEPPADEEGPAAEGTDPVETPGTEDDVVPEVEDVTSAAATLTLVDDTATVVEGRTVTVRVLDNDASDDRIRSLSIDEQGDHGDATVVGARGDQPGQSVPGQGSLRIQYQADEEYVGDDALTYRVTLEDGTTDTATVDVDVEEYVAPIEANFGSTKLRIGVQQADGSYAPTGASTAGSRITIRRIDAGGEDEQTCTTVANPGATDSDCPLVYTQAGGTYEVTQETAGEGFLRSTQRFVVDACTEPDVNIGPVLVPGCEEQLTFVNAGSVLPDAVDDSAASRGGRSVDVDVLANDTSDDPATTLEVDSQPRGGTAKVVGEADRPDEGVPGAPGGVGILAVPTAGSQVVRYTPEPGFEGIDDFTYRLTNSNGSDTATVTVAVSDNGAVTPVDPRTDTDDRSLAGSGSGFVPTSASGTMPSTGGPDEGLLILGAALLAGGTAAVAGSRRRRVTTGG